MQEYGDINKWVEAGKLGHEIREWSKSLIKPGNELLEVAEQIEARIIEKGGFPAWPVSISLNDVAAHYTASPNDPTVFEDEIICVDIGVQIDGAVSDQAYTIDLSGKYTELTKASLEALQNAIKILKPGVTLGEIGKTVEETIQSFGLEPVRNLSGHGVALFKVHTPPSIPNYNNRSNIELTDGQIIAIEPFVTDGKGMIKEKGDPHIFEQVAKKPVRNPITRLVLKEVEQFGGLPFAPRWLNKTLPAAKVSYGLKDLTQQGILQPHPPLVEVSKGMVSQHEHTMLIGEKTKVLTLDN